MASEGASIQAGVWKNGPGVRYAASSRSSQRYDSSLYTPISRNGDDDMDALQRDTSLTFPSLSPDPSQVKTLPKQKKKKKVKTFSLEDDKDLEKKRQKETEKFLQIYQDLHKIRDYFYDEYMVALRKKINQQQKDIKEKDAARERRRRAKVEHERLLSHHVQKKLDRHEFTHDDSYLKKIPKTELNKIVQLQDKLRKNGGLKYNCEVDEFWTAIRKNPTVFNYYLEKLNTDRGTQSLFRQRLNSAQKKALDKLAEEWQSETCESPTPGHSPETKDSWAVTQMYAHQQKSHSSSKSSRRSSTISPSKQALLDLDKRCPKMEMPDLYCFKMDLSRKLPDPLEMLQSAEIQARDHDRKKFLRQLHKMHQLAITHQAASDRILKRHDGDISMLFGGPDINDVIDVNFAIGITGNTDDREDEAVNEVEFNAQLPLPPIASQALENIEGDHGVVSHDTYHSELVLSPDVELNQAALPVPPKALPLTMDEVTDSCKILEAKCSSMYWKNYLQASSSVTT